MKTGRHIVRPLAGCVRHGGLALVALAGSAGWTAAAPAPSSHPSAAVPQETAAQRSPAAQSTESDAGSRNVVARARMLECGHQWSNMKRAGTASGTWKDFSRGCLAQR